MTNSTKDGTRPRVRRMIDLPLHARALALSLLLALTTACSGGEKTPEDSASSAEARAPAGAPREGAEAGENGGKEAGEEGEAGPSTRVTLGEAAFRTARIAVEVPTLESMSAASGGLEVPGQIDFDPARVAIVSPRASGRLERLLVVPGDRVGAGQTVALVQSPAYLTAQNDVLQAHRRLELLRETPDASGAQALLDAARRRLALLGLGEAAIRRLEESATPSALLPVAAPFAGSIIEAQALAGQAVEAGTPLYKIADLSVVNVAADVPERALPALRVGQGATIRVTGAPQAAFAGRVTRVSDVLDPDKRTARALITVANSGRTLKPGMFAAVNLRGGGTSTVPALTIPATSVVADGSALYVFVEVGPRTYERRPVELAPGVVAGAGPAGGRVSVVSGLDADDRVVVRGAFTLKSELAKATLVDED
ncbi:MAG: efflux RND transporter periplasmic adaptor subunit [Gemmatimonadaceae bacterium]|nr:efflux RND transporter periplasmic adaptor subunit [Gemmatimonadaceae bacterium]